jgi:hypothetical protein
MEIHCEYGSPRDFDSARLVNRPARLTVPESSRREDSVRYPTPNDRGALVSPLLNEAGKG